MSVKEQEWGDTITSVKNMLVVNCLQHFHQKLCSDATVLSATAEGRYFSSMEVTLRSHWMNLACSSVSFNAIRFADPRNKWIHAKNPGRIQILGGKNNCAHDGLTCGSREAEHGKM